MKNKVPKKRVTLDDLAVMVAKGFNGITSRMALKSETATKRDLEDAKKELKQEIQSLRNSVNNYLRLSDKRYLELENKQRIVARYLKIIIQKFKIPIDLKELETVLK